MMEITTPAGEDFELFKSIVNQGIDAHLEGFTRSQFEVIDDGQRFRFDFHPSEVHILLRRLREVGTEHAELWAEDIECGQERANQ